MTVDNVSVLLRAREEELSAIYENVPGIVFYIAVEPDGVFRFLSVSRDFLVATGLTREQIVGSLVRDIIPAPSRDMVLDHYREAIRSGQPVRWEEESVYPAGRRHGEVAVTPLYDAAGVATHLIGIVHDITERKLLEESLRENEERLRLAMSSGNIGFWDWDLKSGRTTWSKELEDIFGLDCAGSYEAFSSRVHPDDIAAIESERDAAIRNHKQFDLEFRIVLPSGEIRWLCSRGRGHYDENGRVVRMVGINIDITERVQAEESLREREQRLRLALNASGAGCWMRDSRTGRVDWDDRFRKLYGFTSEEPASGEGWLSRVHKEDRREVLALWDQILHMKTHDTFDITFRIVRPDGTLRWIQSLGQANRGADGQVMRLTGLELDVTERRSAEESLRSVSAELRHTLETAGIGLTHCSRDLRYLSVNPAYAEWIGLPPEEIVGRPIVEVMGEEAFEIIRPRVERVLRGEAVEYEDELRLEGVRKCIQVIYTPDRDASGNVVGWVASVMDITERRQAEESARQQASLLRLSFDAIIVWSFERGIESWNQGAETLYGFTEREAIGRSLQDLLKTVFPVSLSETKTVLWDQGKWEGELRQRTKGGREVVVSSRFQLIAGNDGPVRVLEINRDITERKRMEEERAAEARRKDEFLSLLGHELRNPLAAISTAVQLLSGCVTDEQRASLNEMINRQVSLMQRLLDDLLDLGRITHGYIQLKKERIDLGRFLQHVIEVTQSAVAERGQELILRLPSECVTFQADEARLEQIAINLLTNASKYTERGGKIELSGTREGSQVVFRCKDNGRGIPLQMQQKIFEPFIRVGDLTDSHGEASLGIGLALVKQLVELHGGTISVESSGPGTGSEFSVWLPLESAPLDQPAIPEARPVSTSGLSRSIVVIEDNSDAARAMVIALEQAGYRVTLFADAFSALAGLSDSKPHAVLLDIGLPGMDGYKLAAKLRGTPHLQHTLFIGVSGFKRRATTESGDDFDHYFTKPVNLSSLLDVLGSTPAQAEQATAATAGPAPEKTALRVLLIDDHAALSAMMADLLNRVGLEVRTALSGKEGLEFASDFQPQLILCDLNLPDIGGLEVIRRLRSNPSTRQAYLVILTALSEAEIRAFNNEAKKMGVDEFIRKPLIPEVVHSLVAKFKQ